MSLVGPRVEHPDSVLLYTAEQRHLLDLRPGTTSLASLTYADAEELLLGANPDKTYIDVVLARKAAIDQRYVEHRSFAGDIAILFEPQRCCFSGLSGHTLTVRRARG